MKDKRSPELKKEIAEIYAIKNKYPEIRETCSKMISMLKSEVEGRGVPDNLDRMRKAFKAMVDSLEEDDVEEGDLEEK